MVVNLIVRGINNMQSVSPDQKYIPLVPVLSILAALIPIYFCFTIYTGGDPVENTIFVRGLTSNGLENAMICSISITAPIILEYLLDSTVTRARGHSFRVVRTCGLLIPNIIIIAGVHDPAIQMYIPLFIGRLILNLYYGFIDWKDTPAEYICVRTYVDTFLLLGYTLINDRFFRKELQFAQNTLEVKRAFVNYISHEMRTPLNTIFLGLKLLQDDLILNDDPPSRIEIAQHGGVILQFADEAMTSAIFSTIKIEAFTTPSMTTTMAAFSIASGDTKFPYDTNNNTTSNSVHTSNSGGNLIMSSKTPVKTPKRMLSKKFSRMSFYVPEEKETKQVEEMLKIEVIDTGAVSDRTKVEDPLESSKATPTLPLNIADSHQSIPYQFTAPPSSPPLIRSSRPICFASESLEPAPFHSANKQLKEPFRIISTTTKLLSYQCSQTESLSYVPFSETEKKTPMLAFSSNNSSLNSTTDNTKAPPVVTVPPVTFLKQVATASQMQLQRVYPSVVTQMSFMSPRRGGVGVGVGVDVDVDVGVGVGVGVGIQLVSSHSPMSPFGN
eukprot:gene285-511_t